MYSTKKLIFISSFLLLVSPLFAQGSTSQTLDNVLNARAKTALHAASKKSQPSLQQVLQNLQNEELTFLWWEDFLKENKRAKEIEMASTKTDAQAFKQAEESLETSLADIIQAQTKNAPYEKMAKGQSFIFISENISHDNATAIQEAARIVSDIRKANPKARILLASEFITWTGDTENCSLLKKAGAATCLDAGEEYKPVFDAADKAGIDQLALDDTILQLDEEENIGGIKIGKFLVGVSPQDDVPLLHYVQNPLDDLLLSALQFLSISPWGVMERNRQWARRINALRPFYDIIIVHGGSGHLDATYSLNLAPLLKIKDYLLIDLFAFKELPPEQAAFYKKRAEMAKKAQLCQDDKCAEITLSSIEDSTALANPKTQELFSSIDTNSPAIWLYSDMEKLKQLQKASPKYQEISKTLPYSTDNILVVVLNN